MAVLDHGSSVRDDEQYETLRADGMSKEKAARMANSPGSSEKGSKEEKHEKKSVEELYEQAKKAGIEGRSRMTKEELIEALRDH